MTPDDRGNDLLARAADIVGPAGDPFRRSRLPEHTCDVLSGRGVKAVVEGSHHSEGGLLGGLRCGALRRERQCGEGAAAMRIAFTIDSIGLTEHAAAGYEVRDHQSNE